MEENEYKKRNILIDYTKWLLKWIVILALGLGVLVAIVDGVNTAQVDMFGIECESGESEFITETVGYDKAYYLVKRKLLRDLPRAIHLPAYKAKNLTKELSRQDTVRMKYDFERATQWVYRFETWDGSAYILIDRKTGQVLTGTNTADLSGLSNCQILTPDEFYEKTGGILKRLREKIKI